MNRVKKIVAALLMCCLCVGVFPANIADAETTTEYVQLSGYIGGMGCDEEVDPRSAYISDDNNQIKVVALCEDTNKIYFTMSEKVSSEDGRLFYSLNLEKGHTYILSYEGHVPGRVGNLRHREEIKMDSDKILSLEIQTKMVRGFISAEVEDLYRDLYKVMYPYAVKVEAMDESPSLDGLKKLKYTSLIIEQDEERPLVILTADENEYEVFYDGTEYESADEKIATVDKQGNVKGVSPGSTTITATINGTHATCDVTVTKVTKKRGFDYTKDGFCFLNNATAFFYKRLSDGSYGCGDYVIPKERFDDLYGGCPESYYEDQKSQFTYKYSEGKTNFKGYCFGMTNVAARIYNGQIDIENFSGIRNYDKGVTVNEKLYDGIATGTNSQAVLLMDGDRKLAEEIEKYWLWQSCTTNLEEWKSDNNLPLADVMRDWKKRCYLIGYYYKDENNETHGHSVLTNTASPVPKCERDKDGREYYRIPIYDPNSPAFTDENNELYDKLIKNSIYGNGQRYITVYADGSGFKTDDGENGSEIYIIDVNSMPQDINGSCNFEEPRYILEQDLNNLGDKIGAAILKIRSRGKKELLGIVDVYDGTLEEVYDPKLKLYRLQVVHGNGDSRKYEITYDGDFNDLIFEVEGECHCTAIYGGNIQSVRLNGKGEFSFSEEKVNVNAVDSVKASIMMSSVKNDVVDDGAIANITLDSGEGAQFTLNDQKQYQVVSDDKIDSTVKVYGESGNSDKPSENVSASKKQKISVAKFKKTYSAKKLEQKKVILKLKAKSSGKGKISYKILKGKKNDITVSKNGTVTLKKGCKKGTYKILISANRKGVYKKAKKVITLKVRD